jgi:hypothetical protein
MVNIISDIQTFERMFPNCSNNEKRKDALIKYFKNNGVIKAYESNKSWPKLAYPNQKIIQKKLSEIKIKKDIYSKKLADWNKKYSQAFNYHSIHQLKKIKEPLFWKHRLKLLTDKDYKQDFESVNLPVHLVGDEKWKPMIKMFITDLDYRKQLSLTIKESIVYKNDKKVAKYADEIKDFRLQASDKQIKDIEKKLEVILDYEFALNEFLKWVKE